MEKVKLFLRKNSAVFDWDRIVCRIFAAWTIVIAYGLIKDNKYTELQYNQDISLVNVVLCIEILFIAFSIVNMMLKCYETDTWFLMGGATVCVISWLTAYEAGNTKYMFAFAVSLAYSLILIYFINRNRLLWKMWNPSDRTVWIFAIVCGIICGFVIGAITCYRYKVFATPNFDFGIFVNMFYNMKESGLPITTCERDVFLSHFVVHLSPIYYLILPFYMIFSTPLTLQIAQAVLIASGVIPVVLLCKNFKLSGKTTMVMAFVYSFYPALTTGCGYDIHENCFLTVLLLWVFYFFEREKYKTMYVFAILTLMVKEDAAVYIVIFAIYVLISKKKFRQGLILLVGALVYFSVAYTILESNSSYYAKIYEDATPNPQIAGPMVDRFNNLIYEKDDGLAGAAQTAVVNPGYLLTQLFNTNNSDFNKVIYFIQMILPLGFIPFMTKKPSRWLLLSPMLMNLLTTYVYQYDIGFQYNFGITAFLMYAMISNLPEMDQKVRRNVMGIAFASCACIYLVAAYPSLERNYKNWNTSKDQYIQMEEILETIPKDASVSCSTFLLPHLADREEIYEIHYHGTVGDVDYIVFDARFAVDKKQYDAFIEQGYVLKEEHKGMIVILAKEK